MTHSPPECLSLSLFRNFRLEIVASREATGQICPFLQLSKPSFTASIARFHPNDSTTALKNADNSPAATIGMAQIDFSIGQ